MCDCAGLRAGAGGGEQLCPARSTQARGDNGTDEGDDEALWSLAWLVTKTLSR